MDTKDKANEKIAIIKEQIDKFDNKANILIAIVSIVFAISLSMLDIFREFESITVSYILLLIFTSLYFISFCLEMIFLIITVEAIEEIVLSYLKRVSDFVIDHEKEFIDVAIEHSRMLSKKEIAKKGKQVSEAENRIRTLNKVIQSLYEDKVLGKISEERFILMTEAYEQEQITLKETISNSKCDIERYDEINDNINNFVSVVVKTGRINKLTPEIVRLLIDKIIVSEKVKTESGYKRTVTIFLTHVGEIELP